MIYKPAIPNPKGARSTTLPASTKSASKLPTLSLKGSDTVLKQSTTLCLARIFSNELAHSRKSVEPRIRLCHSILIEIGNQSKESEGIHTYAIYPCPLEVPLSALLNLFFVVGEVCAIED